jgi:DNA-binding NtrC family response regulator
MKILIVDDQETVAEFCRDTLAEAGHEVTTASSAQEALAILNRENIDLVLSDVRMPGMDGIELLRSVSASDHDADVILMTRHAGLSAAVEAVKLGAYDYLEKPLRVDRLEAVVNRLAEVRALRTENATLQSQLPSVRAQHGIVGNSRAMAKVFDAIERFARRRHPVLITGETGTGKELVARALHNLGLGAQQPFIAVDCGALSAGTIESELFGHVRGAFTGSVGDRRGLLETSAGGTLFLDEVGELPLGLQVKLLRVLQDGEFRALGGDKIKRFQGRVIAATNLDFKTAMAAGTFRPELFFRLNVYWIAVPALRERRSDISDLIQHFIAKHGEGRVMSSTPEVTQTLSEQDWQGNIRELESCIVRMVANCDGERLEVRHIPRQYAGNGTAEAQSGSALENAERSAIGEALAAAEGNVSTAARRLGISRATLYRKMNSLGLKSVSQF